MKHKTIRLSRIKISPEMKAAAPRISKMRDKYYFYVRHGKLESTIVVDKRNTIVDGYTSYLLAKMFGIKKVDVEVRED